MRAAWTTLLCLPLFNSPALAAEDQPAVAQLKTRDGKDAGKVTLTPTANGILVGRATDGTNIGANVEALLLATRNVAEGGIGLMRPTAPGNLRTVGK